MDWRQLDYFRVAGRLQHMTRAAEQLGISQPGLSRAIARLERELGVPLFYQVGRSVRLTRYGEAFLVRVDRALHEVDEGRRELADLSGAESGAVALGFLRTLADEYVPQLVRRYRAEHPGVRFTFSQDNSAILERELAAGELDLCFMATDLNNASLASRKVTEQELVLIVPPDHRLAGRRSIRLRDVSGEPFVSFKPGHAMRQFVDDLCAAAGFDPNVTFEGDESSAVRGFVAAGLGVAIVPLSGPSASVASLHISEPVARRSIGIVWVKDRYVSEAALSFRNFVLG
ncbi:MAG TPA: LysR family transcriptional regulator [Candidatus Binatia bacterium]|nr:LysR family transcriptional regulator [Candidatus Binatia bacterium]